jgi:hypothetical protein|tara:strand:+ start:166 stop:567 length:402 start_codon:yes stop_codon:yes gene_type:complete
MKYKVGQQFFQACADDETGKCWVDVWQVRTIRGGHVHLIPKVEHVTWGKLSSKQFHYGWLPGIPSWCRREWPIAGPDPHWEIPSTKLGAWKKILKEAKGKKSYRLTDDPEVLKKIIRTAQSNITKLQNKRNKK